MEAITECVRALAGIDDKRLLIIVVLYALYVIQRTSK